MAPEGAGVVEAVSTYRKIIMVLKTIVADKLV